MIGNDWDQILSVIENSAGFHVFMNKINQLYDKKVVYPEQDNIFKALKLTPYSNVKVVIVGQDPYHGENEANGLSFSVSPGIKLPPSLKNIYKELYDDLKIDRKDNGDLTDWAEQGVLLLNAVLTVEKDKPASHRNFGWELLTDYIIKTLNEKKEPIVFILWGNFAKNKTKLITNQRHLIITSSHPSPFSARYGFFGSKPFSKANNFLISNDISPIKW